MYLESRLSIKVIVGFIVLCVLALGFRIVTNSYDYAQKKIDDATTYETRKEVEDTCRASISSYNTDKLTYEQYKDSESELERSWAVSAKMRANKTATVYNEYILKNSFVFEGNIPNDIYKELEIIE